MDKERDSQGRFLPGHKPLFHGVKNSQGPLPMTYTDYVKTLQKMLKRKEDNKK